MTEILVPHFDFPFHFHNHGGGIKAHVVEQGSYEDVKNCVHTILRTERGSRLYNESFGIEDPAFKTSPLDYAIIESQVHESEPRASAEFSQNFDNLVTEILIELSERA